MRLISEHPPNWGDGSEIGNAAANFAKLPGGERRRRELTTLLHGRLSAALPAQAHQSGAIQ